jgi:hypothetical protein
VRMCRGCMGCVVVEKCAALENGQMGDALSNPRSTLGEKSNWGAGYKRVTSITAIPVMLNVPYQSPRSAGHDIRSFWSLNTMGNPAGQWHRILTEPLPSFRQRCPKHRSGVRALRQSRSFAATYGAAKLELVNQWMCLLECGLTGVNSVNSRELMTRVSLNRERCECDIYLHSTPAYSVFLSLYKIICVWSLLTPSFGSPHPNLWHINDFEVGAGPKRQRPLVISISFRVNTVNLNSHFCRPNLFTI